MNMSDSPLGELNCVSLCVSPSFLSLVVCGFVSVCVRINAHLSVCMAIHSLVFVHWFVGTNVCAACVCVFVFSMTELLIPMKLC